MSFKRKLLLSSLLIIILIITIYINSISQSKTLSVESELSYTLEL